MFQSTREQLLSVGFSVTQIKRRFGITWSKHVLAKASSRQRDSSQLDLIGSQRLPRALRTNTFLSWDFHKRFLPMALRAFSDQQTLQWIFWVEDDCTFKRNLNLTVAKLISVCDRSRASGAVWLGFVSRNGVPAWGSHLIALSRQGALNLKSHLDDLGAQAMQNGKPLQYLMGLDTMMKAFCCVWMNGLPLVVTHSESLAYQRSHELAGRK